jgi:class 3 adenylate cyclase/tetratricopeptide (TPR) repeat protein
VQAEEATPARPSQQRRYVAVLYADLCGSTELATNLEAELYAAVLDALKAIYREIIPLHGGTLLQVHGDGHLSMFGYPGAGEEDVRLAVNAALALHQAVKDLRLNVPDLPSDLNLRLHSGVHAGLVLVSEGDMYGGSYQLRGEVTNICARLSDAAGEDEILVGGESLRGSEPFFVCGRQRQVQLKGVAAELVVFPVHGVTDLSTRYQARRLRSRMPFFGRGDEVRLLEKQWGAVQKGEPRLVYIVGSPGVGKTRLADEFLSHLERQGQTVLRGFCETLSTAQPLESILRMMRSAAVQSPGLATTLALEPELRAALDGYVEDVSKLATLATTLIEFVVGYCRVAPLVMFVDDWQWADETSKRLLAQIAVRRDLPLMIVLATRAVEPSEPSMLVPATTVQLDGLHGEGLEAAIRSLLPQADPFVKRKIESLSGGNPLFLEELCQASTVDVLDHRPSRVEHVPQWLYGLVQNRVAQLGDRERGIVEVAAVIGSSVPLWLLQRVAEFEGVELLTGPTILDLLFPGGDPGEWHFKHGLTRAIVYDFVGLRERQRLHRTIAQVMLESDIGEAHHLEALAYHFAGAGMREEAIYYAEQAGERAMSIPALDIARVQYRLAIDLLDHGDITLPVYEQILAMAKRLSFVAIFDPGADELPVFWRVLELAKVREDVKAQGNANYWLGRVHYGLGKPRRALHYFYQARTLAQACGFESLVLDTSTALAQATAANCEHDNARHLLERALLDMRKVEVGSPQASAVAYALGCLGMVLGDQGHFTNALEHFSEAERLISDSGNPTTANVMAKLVALHIWREDWDAAITTADSVARNSEQIRNFYLFGMSRMMSAYAHWRRDGRSEHVDTMRETTSWLENSQLGQFLSLNYGWLAEVSATLGDHQSVRRYLAKALRRDRQGDGFGLAVAARAACDAGLQRAWHRPPEAYLLLAERSVKQRGSVREQALNKACAVRLAGHRANGHG